MAKLSNLSKSKVLLNDLSSATSFAARSRGLIGRPDLGADEGLWIHQCNWIHTFFMSMPIDVIYVDRAMRVQKITVEMKPWRLGKPVFTASSVIEVKSGLTKTLDLELGDILHVGD